MEREGCIGSELEGSVHLKDEELERKMLKVRCSEPNLVTWIRDEGRLNLCGFDHNQLELEFRAIRIRFQAIGTLDDRNGFGRPMLAIDVYL